jgi:hypothetical protein
MDIKSCYSCLVKDWETAVILAAQFKGAFAQYGNGFIVYWQPKGNRNHANK